MGPTIRPQSPPCYVEVGGHRPPATGSHASSTTTSTQPPAPPQQRGKSQRGAFEQHQGAALPVPAHPQSPPSPLSWPGAATGSQQPILGTRASLAAGTGGRASAGKSTLRAGGRPMEPSWAGNRGHTSCHGRLGSAPVPPVPASAPGRDWVPSLPLCPSPGPLLAQPSPACASQAFPTLRLAELGLSPKPSTARTPTVVPMVHHQGPTCSCGASTGGKGEPATLTTCRQGAGSSGSSGSATCPLTPCPAMALAASQAAG